MTRMVWTVALAFAAAQVSAADRAVPRGGGGGSDRSASSAGDRRPSSSGASSSSSSSTRSGSSGSYQKTGEAASSSSRSRAVPRTDAQRRHPRPGTGTGDRGYDGDGYRYGYRYGNRYRYGSWGYYPAYGWYDPYYWSGGYSPYYYGGYYGYSPSYYRRTRGYRDSGAVRVIVEPEKTRVYVDGYYAGVADDFDGIFQRLYLPPGRHDVTLKLEGYRTQHFKVYVPVDGTIKLHFDMVRGAGEATSEQYAGEPADYARIREDDERMAREDDRDDEDDDAYRHDARYSRQRIERSGAAMVRFDVEPSDASIYVDGEFKGPARRLSALRLPEGPHRVEIVRPGYRTDEREIDVREGGDLDVRVQLVRE